MLGSHLLTHSNFKLTYHLFILLEKILFFVLRYSHKKHSLISQTPWLLPIFLTRMPQLSSSISYGQFINPLISKNPFTVDIKLKEKIQTLSKPYADKATQIRTL